MHIYKQPFSLRLQWVILFHISQCVEKQVCTDCKPKALGKFALSNAENVLVC